MLRRSELRDHGRTGCKKVLACVFGGIGTHRTGRVVLLQRGVVLRRGGTCVTPSTVRHVRCLLYRSAPLHPSGSSWIMQAVTVTASHVIPCKARDHLACTQPCFLPTLVKPNSSSLDIAYVVIPSEAAGRVEENGLNGEISPHRSDALLK